MPRKKLTKEQIEYISRHKSIYPVKYVAHKLNISPTTVKRYIYQMERKETWNYQWDFKKQA